MRRGIARGLSGGLGVRFGPPQYQPLPWKAGVGRIVDWVPSKGLSSSTSKPNPPKFEYEVERLYDTNYLNVPKLPLPQLQDTVKRYLETIKPLTTAEEFAHSKKLAEDFLKNEGPTLHSALKAINDAPGYPYSYIEEFWDEMYLGGRWSLMININPYYLLNDDSDPAQMDQCVRGSRFASSIIRFWQKVTSGNLEMDMERDSPLCMYQYGVLLGVGRKPETGRDALAYYPRSKHIVVIYRNNYFKVPVIDDQGLAISTKKLEETFREIKAMNLPDGKPSNVGIFTTEDRDVWATIRKDLESFHKSNLDSLEIMDESLFVVVLEDTDCDSLVERARCILHGMDGSNRWFDKHQVIVTPDGALGMSFEHSTNDGMTWNRMLHEVWHDMYGTDSGFSKLPSDMEGATLSRLEMLEWKLSDKAKSSMVSSAKNAKQLIDDTESFVLDFNEFGRNEIKNWKLSPDAVAQMAIQLAYAKLHGRSVATYEACAMKNYFHGRTETIRSCTTDSVDMVKAFLNDASDDEKRTKLATAAATHVEVAKGAKAAIGPFQGVDRHLYSMKCLAQKRGMEVEFFQDPVYSRSSTWVISTSNVSAPIYSLFGFGAVAPEGYGIGYMTLANSLPFHITSYRSSPETSSEDMGHAIQDSLYQFKKLF